MPSVSPGHQMGLFYSSAEGQYALVAEAVCFQRAAGVGYPASNTRENVLMAGY